MFLNTFQGVCGKERRHKGRKTRASQYQAKKYPRNNNPTELGQEKVSLGRPSNKDKLKDR